METKDLLGRVLINIENQGDELHLWTADKHYCYYHDQDCCEDVSIEEIHGDLKDLIGEPLLIADETTHDATQAQQYPESATWTFYRFATRKGHVTVRWLGESNGYYSESVSLKEITNG